MFIHWRADGHLDCFQFGAIPNANARDIPQPHATKGLSELLFYKHILRSMVTLLSSQSEPVLSSYLHKNHPPLAPLPGAAAQLLRIKRAPREISQGACATRDACADDRDRWQILGGGGSGGGGGACGGPGLRGMGALALWLSTAPPPWPPTWLRKRWS